MSIFRKTISAILSLTLVLSFFSIIPQVKAETTNAKATIEIEGECLYDDAFEVFEQVNDVRVSRGLKPLIMNSTLLQVAMQRAAEIAVCFDHTRPDGTSCFDIDPNVHGENIAVVYTNPDEVVQGWLNSSGHYANIVSTRFTSVGVGAIIHNGTHYWVQVFGTTNTNSITTPPINTTKSFSIYLGNNAYTLSLSLPEKIYITDIDKVQVIGKNSMYNRYFVVNPSTLNYSSSNSSVMSTTDDTLTALSEGNATLTVQNSAVTLKTNIEVKEFSKGKSRLCGDNITWEYNNKVLTFSGSGEMYDYNTTYDKNGLISSDVLWSDAFDKVEKVVVDDNITYIGNSAFACFNELNSVTLPQSVTAIGNDAFALCKKLSHITLPDSISTIGTNTFYKCSQLTDVKLPANLSEIKTNMFYSCGKLRSIDIPDSVQSIGQSAFAYCYELNSIVLPENLKSIGVLAFINCSALKEITIPNNVESINRKAFIDCTSLSKVTLLNPTTMISTESVFDNTSSTLTMYGFADSSAENYCKSNNIEFVVIEGSKPIVTANGYTTTYTGNPVTDDISVNVENVSGDYSVKFSKGDTFDYNASFGSIKELGEYWRNGASYYDRNKGYLLNSGTYPITYCVYSSSSQPVFGTVEIVVNKATPSFSFEKDYVEFPWYSKGDNMGGYLNPLNDRGDLGEYDISFASSNTDILITDYHGRVFAKRYGECTVTASYDGDSNHNPHSASFSVKTYPLGVLITDNFNCEFFGDRTVSIKRYLGKEAELSIPAELIGSPVTAIDEKAFYSCSVEKVTIPQGISHIKTGAFTSCYLLNEVTISDTVTTIDDYAFSGCRKLKSVSIPSTVTNIGKEAFGYTVATDSTPSSKIDGFVIYGYKNTEAEKYAMENGFEFIELAPPYVLGDVDRDGELSILDATAIQLFVARLTNFDEEQKRIADFTQEGNVDVMDATGIQLKLAGLI